MRSFASANEVRLSTMGIAFLLQTTQKTRQNIGRQLEAGNRKQAEPQSLKKGETNEVKPTIAQFTSGRQFPG